MMLIKNKRIVGSKGSWLKRKAGGGVQGGGLKRGPSVYFKIS